MNNLGVNRRFMGDYDGARRWLEESVRTCRELGDRGAIASALSNLADVLRRQGTTTRRGRRSSKRCRSSPTPATRPDRLGRSTTSATSRAPRAIWSRPAGPTSAAPSIFRAVGDAMGVARSAIDLGHLACEAGDLTVAHALFTEAIRRSPRRTIALGVAIALEAFACAATLEQDRDRALTLAGAAASVRRTVGSGAAARDVAGHPARARHRRSLGVRRCAGRRPPQRRRAPVDRRGGGLRARGPTRSGLDDGSRPRYE